MACAAALAVFREVLAQDLPARARRLGEYFATGLETLQARWPVIREVRGRGLLLAVQFDRDVAQAVLEAALERGLLLNAVTPSAIRLMPPLVIGEAEIDHAVAVLDAALAATLTTARAGS